jgi:hypothetical protein
MPLSSTLWQETTSNVTRQLEKFCRGLFNWTEMNGGAKGSTSCGN